jgi:cytochrome c553
MRPDANIRQQFDAGVQSMHPVSRPPLGRRQVSLMSLAVTGSSMSCADCHTNDDPNGPAGPHGSSYPKLLNRNYNTDLYVDESPYEFDFCYQCHDRNSILADESFPWHSEHLVGDAITGRKGTSCYTCHASHGSQSGQHLIRFNPDRVSPSPRFGIREYRQTGEGRGECYLLCHDHAHEPAAYDSMD